MAPHLTFKDVPVEYIFLKYKTSRSFRLSCTLRAIIISAWVAGLKTVCRTVHNRIRFYCLMVVIIAAILKTVAGLVGQCVTKQVLYKEKYKEWEYIAEVTLSMVGHTLILKRGELPLQAPWSATFIHGMFLVFDGFRLCTALSLQTGNVVAFIVKQMGGCVLSGGLHCGPGDVILATLMALSWGVLLPSALEAWIELRERHAFAAKYSLELENLGAFWQWLDRNCKALEGWFMGRRVVSRPQEGAGQASTPDVGAELGGEAAAAAAGASSSKAKVAGLGVLEELSEGLSVLGRPGENSAGGRAETHAGG